MDFGNIKGITIPEGTVIKITSGKKILWTRSALPSAYQQVEYISADGNQYIDTNVIAADHPDGIRYVFVGSFTDFTIYESNNYIFGAYDSGTNIRSCNCCVCPYGEGTRRFGIMSGANATRRFGTENIPETGTVFTLDVTCSSNDLENAYATLNGVALGGESGYSNGAMPPKSIFLFTCASFENSETNGKFYGKLYSFVMNDADGTPIRNFIPCYRKSDNVIGLYDTVSKEFFTNSGSGSFGMGGEIF